MSAFDSGLFGKPGGYEVRILDLSGGNGADPVETIRGFATLEHANAFARRYVRDSLERCRTRGMTPDQVMQAWFAFGEDAEVIATLRAAEFAAMGDRKGLADWDDIIACVAALQAGGTGGATLN